MTKTITCLALASLSMVLAACNESNDGTAYAATTAPLAPEAFQPVSDIDDKIEWELIAENADGRHFIERSARERANLVATDAFGAVRVEFSQPKGRATAVEGLYQFNCDQGTQRLLVAETFDMEGLSVNHDNRETVWVRPKPDTIAMTYHRAACTPKRASDG